MLNHVKMITCHILGGRTLRIAVGITMLVILLLARSAGAQNNISSYTTIGSPGTYVLTQSIINSGAAHCIRITSSDVIFDGAGNTIDGKDSEKTFGVHVYNTTTALTNVTVKNLIVTDWDFGIIYENTVNGSIEDNSVSSNERGIRLFTSHYNSIIASACKF